MGGTKLGCSSWLKKLGVIIDQNRSGSSQCVAAVKKANRVLECIARSIEYKSKEVVLTLYQYSTGRPHLEYCVTLY